MDATLWVRLAEIIGVNIMLSGDNAVVIALAARSLPVAMRRTAIVLGSVAAILMRVALTVVAAEMLELRWLRLVGGALLLWIGVKLLIPTDDGELTAGTSKGVWGAVRTILLADLIMSLDNVLGVAAAAHGSKSLLIAGLAISVPLIVFGSTVILHVMDRFSFVIILGAALIGWVAGEMLVSDSVIAEHIPQHLQHGLELAGGAVAAILVVAVGWWLGRRASRQQDEVLEPRDISRG
ncbi:MAG TPA: TerC family protein [Burkholderiales bacterium]|nr:TerC family protein [Burkholderiales bacterium]